MDSFELAARYSFMPNKLKYCGPEDTDQILFDYVKGKADKMVVKQILEQFNALYLYLNLVAKHNNKDVFDKDVVEAYWLGNKLLDKVPSEDIKNLILNDFTKAGMPKSVAIELASKVPKEAVPHHSFHVLHIHSMTNKISPTLTNIDKCRISWGKVRHIGKDKLIVAYRPLEAKGKLKLGEPREIEVNYHKEFLPNLKVDDYISMHWNLAIQILDEKQVESLRKYTEKNIEAMNKL